MRFWYLKGPFKMFRTDQLLVLDSSKYVGVIQTKRYRKEREGTIFYQSFFFSEKASLSVRLKKTTTVFGLRDGASELPIESIFQYSLPPPPGWYLNKYRTLYVLNVSISVIYQLYYCTILYHHSMFAEF